MQDFGNNCIFVEKKTEMKVKFVIIYALAGVAFLAVSLWAFLSNGRSAKAIRYKYKLGGIMLTAWAMLSAASCEGVPPFVTCYEPVVECYDVAAPSNEVYVEVKDYGGNKLKSGDVLTVRIDYPTYRNYRCRITADPSNGDAFVIQTQDFTVTESDSSVEITLVATDYKGNAKVTVCGIGMMQDGSEVESVVGTASVTIL